MDEGCSPLGVCRILIVGIQLVMLHLVFPADMNRRHGSLPSALYDPLPLLHLFVWPFGWNARPSPELNEIIRWITSGLGVLGLIGFVTRPSLVGFALGNAYLMAFKYSFKEFHHAEALPAIALGVLALSPAGAALSVDDLRRRVREAMAKRSFRPFRHDEESNFARWPLLLIGWLMAAAYLSATLSKIGQAGFEWLNGYTLQFYLLQEGLRWDRSLGIWLSQFHGLAVFLSWMTVLFESTFFLILLVPRLIWIYLPLGMIWHVGMDMALHAFFYQFVAIYLVFIPWSALRERLSRRFARRAWARPEILFDEECPLCIRSMTVVRYADWFDRLDYSELGRRWPEVAARYPGLSRAECRRRMHVFQSDGTVASGFFAFRKILPYLPPLWLLFPLFYFPLASRVGPLLYDYVAARRGRFLVCDDTTCAVAPDLTMG